MPYCPNPDCRFRKRFGEAAEYNPGSVTCSDCDTPLVAADLLGKVVKEKKQFKMRDIYMRLLWTCGLLGFWNVLRHFPLPGMNSEALGQNAGFHISLFSLGLLPYITAYVLVEIVALFLQPFKGWRTAEGGSGRARLAGTARYLALVLGAVHGGLIVRNIENMANGQALVDNGFAFKSVLVLTLVAAMFLTIWLADQVSARGCGHGISLIFLADIVGGIPHNAEQVLKHFKGALASSQVLMPVLTVIGLLALIAYVEKSVRYVPIRYSDGTEVSFSIKLTTAGTTPVWWASSLLSLPLAFLPMNVSYTPTSYPTAFWITTNFYPGTAFYTAANAILVIFLYFLFTALFYNPREIMKYLRERAASPVSDRVNKRGSLDRSLESMALVGSLYLVLLLSLPAVIGKLLEEPRVLPKGISMIIAVCVALDLAAEMRLRWRSEKCVAFAEFHEPWKASLFRSLLEKEGVSCVVRGFYHRALLYLFGPYIEMTVYVAADKEDIARNIERRYMNVGTLM